MAKKKIIIELEIDTDLSNEYLNSFYYKVLDNRTVEKLDVKVCNL